MAIANAYIDGFNFYYGCVKGTSYKWLNLSELCRCLLPKQFTLGAVKYFTARVSGLPSDPDKPTRQQTYLRALATVPDIQVVYGHFMRHPVRMPLVNPPATGSKFAEVIRTEEKGSDVNLATHLLVDAFTRVCDAALILSNDSDLLLPIKTARRRFLLKTIIVSPHPKPSLALVAEADFRRQIREWMLRSSLFSDPLSDSVGIFRKPTGW